MACQFSISSGTIATAAPRRFAPSTFSNSTVRICGIGREERKAVLKMLLHPPHPGITYNRHFDVEGSIIFHHACKLGCEGIVSKRLGSLYCAGRSADWLKVKNPEALAVKREAE
jgi:hypothetical protein